MAYPADRSTAPTPIDRAGSFRYACRPECGLCCYATPQVRPEERSTVLRLDPGLVLEAEDDGWSALPLQGVGGGCVWLADRRCAHHTGRPSPCHRYPVHLHAGVRVQATVVLACPGALLEPGAEPRDSTRWTGLDAEWSATRDLLTAPDIVGLLEDAQEEHAALRRESQGRSHPEEEVAQRRAWAIDPPMPAREDFPGPAGPDESEGLETLPIFQHPTYGTVAISEAERRVELLVVRPGGGIGDRLGSYPRPERAPTLEPSARRLLAGYLGLLAERDAVADAVRWEWLDEGGSGEYLDRLAGFLQGAGTLTLVRAGIAAMLQGRPGGWLDDEDLRAGIRATDAEILDRPVIGANL